MNALDEGASRLKIKTGKYCSRAGGASLMFRPEVVGRAPIFGTPYSMDVFCDRRLRVALVPAGLKGLRLQDATDL